MALQWSFVPSDLNFDTEGSANQKTFSINDPTLSPGVTRTATISFENNVPADDGAFSAPATVVYSKDPTSFTVTCTAKFDSNGHRKPLSPYGQYVTLKVVDGGSTITASLFAKTEWIVSGTWVTTFIAQVPSSEIPLEAWQARSVVTGQPLSGVPVTISPVNGQYTVSAIQSHTNSNGGLDITIFPDPSLLTGTKAIDVFNGNDHSIFPDGDSAWIEVKHKSWYPEIFPIELRGATLQTDPNTGTASFEVHPSYVDDNGITRFLPLEADIETIVDEDYDVISHPLFIEESFDHQYRTIHVVSGAKLGTCKITIFPKSPESIREQFKREQIVRNLDAYIDASQADPSVALPESTINENVNINIRAVQKSHQTVGIANQPMLVLLDDDDEDAIQLGAVNASTDSNGNFSFQVRRIAPEFFPVRTAHANVLFADGSGNPISDLDSAARVIYFDITHP